MFAIFKIFGFIVLFDIFPFLFYFKKKLPTIVIHMPFILTWFISVILLIFFFVSTRSLNNEINSSVDLYVGEINNDKIIREKLLKNIRRRTKYKKPKGFKIVSTIYLVCYTPLSLRLIWGADAGSLFKLFAFGIVGVYYVYDLIKFLCIKRKQKNKLKMYKEVFSKNQKDLDLFAIKKAEIYDKMDRADVGDKIMGFSYFFGVLFLYILYLSYINILTVKISDNDSEYKWGVILIPADVIGFFVTLYTGLFLCSIWRINVQYKWILIITSIISSLCFLINYVIYPNVALVSEKSFNFLYPIGLNIVLSISIIIHCVFNKKFEEKCNEIS